MQSKKSTKSIVPDKLSITEQYYFDHHIRMEDYWFEAIIRKQCRYVDRKLIFWEKGEGQKYKETPVFAEVFARDCIQNAGKPDEMDGIYCYFIYFKRKVWKSEGIANTTELLAIIQKEHNREKYEDEMEGAKKQKEGKQKKLKAGTKLKIVGKRKKVA